MLDHCTRCGHPSPVWEVCDTCFDDLYPPHTGWLDRTQRMLWVGVGLLFTVMVTAQVLHWMEIL